MNTHSTTVEVLSTVEMISSFSLLKWISVSPLVFRNIQATSMVDAFEFNFFMYVVYRRYLHYPNVEICMPPHLDTSNITSPVGTIYMSRCVWVVCVCGGCVGTHVVSVYLH